MKHGVVVCGLMLLVSGAMAQTEQGRGFWSGGAGTKFSRTERLQLREREQVYQVFVNRSVFLQRNTLLGLELRGSSEQARQTQPLDDDTFTDRRRQTLGAAPFIRRYWGRQEWRVFMGAGIAASWSRLRTRSQSTGPLFSQTYDDEFQVAPEVQAGFAYFINGRWGIEATTRSSVFPLTVSNLQIGMTYLTGGRPITRTVRPALPPNQLLATNWIIGGGFLVTDRTRQLIPSQNKDEVFRRETRRGIALNPAIGYTLADRLVVGVALPVSYGIVTDTYLNTPGQAGIRVERWSAGVQPFVKKYINNRKLTPFATVLASWEWSDDGNVTDTYNARLGAGLAYMLGTRFILEAELGDISYGWARTRNGETRQTFGDANATLRPGFTISYVFL